MATCVVEQIAVKILAALQEIVAAGDAALVERPLRIGVPSSPRDKALYLYQDDPTEDEGPVGGWLQWLQPFLVDCFVVPSDDSATAVDTEINELRAQVEKKLRETPQWGLPGAAIDTRIEAPVGFTDINGTFAGVRVTAVVQYRTREDDPYAYT